MPTYQHPILAIADPIALVALMSYLWGFAPAIVLFLAGVSYLVSIILGLRQLYRGD